MPSDFVRIIDDPIKVRHAVEMLKDKCLPDFINVEEIGQRESIDVDECAVEQRIVQSIKNSAMTFGHDFASIGNQYHLKIYGIEQFPDLLFFDKKLNAMVVVELKLGKFKTLYLGQLFGYLQTFDDHVCKSHESPSIDTVLYQAANHPYTQYAVCNYTRPIGVATHKILDDMLEKPCKALPDVDRMIEVLKKKG